MEVQAQHGSGDHHGGGGGGHKKHHKKRGSHHEVVSPMTSPPQNGPMSSTGNSMLAQLQPNLRMRRKSSPAIHEIGALNFTVGGQLVGQGASSGYSTSRGHSGHQGGGGHGGLYAPSAAQLASRRLSSPPSLEKDAMAFGFPPGVGNMGKDDGESSSSSGSLHKYGAANSSRTSTSHPVSSLEGIKKAERSAKLKYLN